MTSLKNEDNIEKLERPLRLELICPVKKAYDRQLFFRSVRKFYNVLLQRLLDAVKKLGDHITDGCSFSLWCSLKRWPTSRAFQILDDLLSLKGMRANADFLSVVMDLGPHDHMLHSSLHVKIWLSLMTKELEYMVEPTKKRSKLMSVETCYRMTATIEVSIEVLQFVQYRELYLSSARMKSLCHFTVASSWSASGKKRFEMLRQMDFNAPQGVISGYPSFTNVPIVIPPLSSN